MNYPKQPINAPPRSYADLMKERLEKDLDLNLILAGARIVPWPRDFLVFTPDQVGIILTADTCTCGAQAINCASHSHWCDSNRGGTTR